MLPQYWGEVGETNFLTCTLNGVRVMIERDGLHYIHNEFTDLQQLKLIPRICYLSCKASFI